MSGRLLVTRLTGQRRGGARRLIWPGAGLAGLLVLVAGSPALPEPGRVALAGLLLLLGPGLLLARLGWPGLSRSEQVLAGFGLSVAAAPLLLLWATVASVPLTPPAVLAGLLVVTAWALFAVGNPRPDVGVRAAGRSDLPTILIWLTVAALVVIGWLAVRGVSIPLWGDGLQHTIVARLIADRGQVPNSYLPYLPLDTFTYHFGFHVLAAWLQWLAGVETPRAVALAGQALIVLSPATAGLLTWRLTGNRWAALTAIGVIGLVSPMPAYYLNWSRFTSLAALVVLPVAAAACIDLVERPERRWRLALLAGVLVAGLIVVHYRVAAFFLALMLPWAMTLLWKRRDLRGLGEAALRLAVAAAVGIGLAAPWIAHLLRDLPQAMTAFPPRTAGDWQQLASEYNTFHNFFEYVPPGLLGLGLLAVVVGLVVPARTPLLMAGWAAFLFLMANPNVLGLPYYGWFNNFGAIVVLYAPLGTAAGWLVGYVFERIERRAAFGRAQIRVGSRGVQQYARTVGSSPPPAPGWQTLWRSGHCPLPTAHCPLVLAIPLLVAMIVFFGPARAGGLDAAWALVTPADERAMGWIRQHVPAESVFLVNGFFAHGDKTLVGSDAGWWLPQLAGRQATVQPQLYQMERSLAPGWAGRVNAFGRDVYARMAEGTAWPLLRARGIDYIFLGDKGGTLRPEQVEREPRFQLVYRDGGVRIYRVGD